MGLAANIKRLREAAGLSQEEVADALGVDRSTISQWETGWYQPRMKRISDIAGYFGVTASELVAETHKSATVPLVSLGIVHAGSFSDEEPVERSVEVPASIIERHPHAKAALVEGDCMDRVIPDGAIVVFDPDMEPTYDKIAIVETEDHQAVMRRWRPDGDTLRLVADSHRAIDDLVITGDDPIRVLGTAIWMQSVREL